MYEGCFREGAADVFGLSAVARVGGHGIAEELAFAAARGLAADAVEAVAAGGVEGDDDLWVWGRGSMSACVAGVRGMGLWRTVLYLVANLEALHIVTLLHNLADELMAADKVRWALHVAAVEVQVAAAEGGGGNSENGIGRELDLGVGAVFYCYLDGVVSSASCRSRDELEIGGGAE